jgi:hypothetical protein
MYFTSRRFGFKLVISWLRVTHDSELTGVPCTGWLWRWDWNAHTHERPGLQMPLPTSLLKGCSGLVKIPPPPSNWVQVHCHSSFWDRMDMTGAGLRGLFLSTNETIKASTAVAARWHLILHLSLHHRPGVIHCTPRTPCLSGPQHPLPVLCFASSVPQPNNKWSLFFLFWVHN